MYKTTYLISVSTKMDSFSLKSRIKVILVSIFYFFPQNVGGISTLCNKEEKSRLITAGSDHLRESSTFYRVTYSTFPHTGPKVGTTFPLGAKTGMWHVFATLAFDSGGNLHKLWTVQVFSSLGV